MRKILSLVVAMLCAIGVQAADYTTYLTSARGFTEVTSTSQILTGDYYYALVSAEKSDLIVGICPAGDRKAGWAPDNSLAMCYKPVVTDPILNRKNFWIIEKSDNFIGFRNLYHNVCLFQTNDGQGYLYFAGFYYEHDISEWDCLAPTFQDGYWMFESGKYPISSNDWASGFLGPWDKVVKAGETMALNRKNVDGDLAGHYRLFRIPKNTFESLYNTEIQAQINSPAAGKPIDYTSKIVNPSFENGETGWTITPVDGSDMGARTYTLTGMEGKYVGNFYNWWGNVSIEQTISNLPAGTYKISAIMGTWAQRYTMGFTVNDNTITLKGTGDSNGIPVSQIIPLTGSTNSITIRAYQNVDWWSAGRGGENSGGLGTDECGFFKIDDIRLTYYSTIPALPNDESTILTPDTWYYYDAPASGKYILTGKLSGMTYLDELPDIDITGNLTKREMGFPAGRIYFRTQRSDATLKVEPAEDATTFTVATLNVDGLPLTLTFPIVGSKDINPDGPGTNGTKLISSYIANKQIDVLAFQEDFNFDNELKSNMSGYTFGTHRENITTNLIYTRPADTDGLQFATRNAVASFANEGITQFTDSYSEDEINIAQFKANIKDGNSLIKKGYRYYEVTVGGEKVDVYITHADAGTTDQSSTDPFVVSRGKQLKQIAQAILAKGNTDRPKIFMGDTNCRWTREDIKTNFFDILSGTYDVSDAWVGLVNSGNYPIVGVDPNLDNEVVDKIIYINPKGNNVKKLTPISYLHDTQDYVNSSGNLLGDHAPVIVKFGLGLYEEVDNTVSFPDVTQDGIFDIQDILATVQILLGNSSPSYNEAAADVDGKEGVTIGDVTEMMNLLMAE